jgi:hypothetical protein
MRSRRLKSSMRSQWRTTTFALGSAAHSACHRQAPQVLGADLKCSESPWALPSFQRMGETAALQDFNPTYDRNGSIATEIA